MATLLEAKSKYQHIKVTNDRLHDGEIILWLDDMWQFGSHIEYRYHEALITLPMCVAPQIDRVLVCGGGDGLALREALKFKECIPTLCELDGGMIEVFRMAEYAKYNKNSLSDPRAKIVIEDAIKFMDQTAHFTNEKFNLIVWDFPSPSSDEDDKDCGGLYTKENLQKALKCLAPNGVFASQVSIPIVTLSVIIKELMLQDYYVWTYDTMYDSGGNHDSFIVASKTKLWQQRPIPEDCRFVSEKKIKAGFSAATLVVPEDFNYYLEFLYNGEVD